MAEYIVQLENDKYVVWSTGLGRPTTSVSSYSVKISFHKLEIDVSMVGTYHYYTFKTWMEK